MIRGLQGFEVAPAHFVERHGLVLIVVIGESVVAVGIGASGLAVDAGLAFVALLGLMLSTCLWWVYFGQGDDEQAAKALASMPPLPRARLALTAFFYSYLPMLLGIVTIAAAEHAAIEHPFDALSVARALLLSGGVALSSPVRSHSAANSVWQCTRAGLWSCRSRSLQFRLERGFPRSPRVVSLLGLLSVAIAIDRAGGARTRTR